jgi:hypothetical protein
MRPVGLHFKHVAVSAGTVFLGTFTQVLDGLVTVTELAQRRGTYSTANSQMPPVRPPDRLWPL